MNIFSNLWSKMDGKKALTGWLITQIPMLGQPTMYGYFTDAVNSWIGAVATHNPAIAISPTLIFAGQTLLALGIAHHVIKDNVDKAVENVPNVVVMTTSSPSQTIPTPKA